MTSGQIIKNTGKFFGLSEMTHPACIYGDDCYDSRVARAQKIRSTKNMLISVPIYTLAFTQTKFCKLQKHRLTNDYINYRPILKRFCHRFFNHFKRCYTTHLNQVFVCFRPSCS